MRRRRHEDPLEEDHREERHSDWSDSVSKKFLVKLVTLAFGACGFLGAGAVTLIKNDYDRLEQKYADAKWEEISRLSVQSSQARSDVRRFEGILDGYDLRLKRIEDTDVRAQLVRLSGQIERLNEQLTQIRQKGL